jgi:hypothetical protein
MGNSYYRARYYDPLRSRFVSEDAIGIDATVSLAGATAADARASGADEPEGDVGAVETYLPLAYAPSQPAGAAGSPAAALADDPLLGRRRRAGILTSRRSIVAAYPWPTRRAGGQLSGLAAGERGAVGTWQGSLAFKRLRARRQPHFQCDPCSSLAFDISTRARSHPRTGPALIVSSNVPRVTGVSP